MNIPPIFPFFLFWLSIGSKHFTMSSKRREYHVDRRAKKAAIFFVACD
jgi:hypothetical protein